MSAATHYSVNHISKSVIRLFFFRQFILDFNSPVFYIFNAGDTTTTGRVWRKTRTENGGQQKESPAQTANVTPKDKYKICKCSLLGSQPTKTLLNKTCGSSILLCKLIIFPPEISQVYTTQNQTGAYILKYRP